MTQILSVVVSWFDVAPRVDDGVGTQQGLLFQQFALIHPPIEGRPSLRFTNEQKLPALILSVTIQVYRFLS